MAKLTKKRYWRKSSRDSIDVCDIGNLKRGTFSMF